MIDPELEVWVWSDSPHVDRILQWQDRRPSLREWLVEQKFLVPEEVKPERPKEAVENALRIVRLPRSSALYRQIRESIDNRRVLMQNEDTNFDRYLARKLQNSEFRARFEAADQAWDIALQLTALRQARGLTQKQVAEMLGTAQQAIARLEDPAYTGHSLRMVRKYVEALGASLDVIVVPVETSSTYSVQRGPKPLLVAG